MPRLAKKLNEKNLMSKDDFTRAKKMTKKDWDLCKKDFDQVYLKIHEKDKEIVALNKVVEDGKKRSRECVDRLREELKYTDNNLLAWKKRYEEKASSVRFQKRISVVSFLWGIILGMAISYIIVCSL